MTIGKMENDRDLLGDLILTPAWKYAATSSNWRAAPCYRSRILNFVQSTIVVQFCMPRVYCAGAPGPA